MGFPLGGGGGGLPRSCRAGDDSFGHFHPGRGYQQNQIMNIIGERLFDYYPFIVCCFVGSLCRGGGSVRRRNALHEVGGRVPEVPRVRNARAGSETHTHINIFTHNYFIFILSTYVSKFSQNKIIKKIIKKSAEIL